MRGLWTATKMVAAWLPSRLLRLLLDRRRSRRRAVLNLRLSGVVADAGAGLLRGQDGRLSLPALLRILKDAGEDPSVEGVALRVGRLAAAWGPLDELRDALLALRGAGRSVHVLLERPGHAEYYLATACDHVALPPVAGLDLVGLRAEVSFFKPALDKLGVGAEFESAGEFKSFAEPFTREGMSDEFRESLDAVLRALHGRLVAAVGSGRRKEEAEVQALIDGGPYTAAEALEHGLVDAVLYPDRWKRLIRRSLRDGKEPKDDKTAERDGAFLDPAPEATREEAQGRVRVPAPRDRRLHFVPASRYLRPWRWLRRLERWALPAPRVAVVVAEGGILDSDERVAPPGRIAWRPMSAILEALRKDERFEAVVLRVDSPGGSAAASDLLWRQLRRLGATKPLVASMGGVAASGGYYLAMAAETVYADAATLTGSIGVVGGKFEISGLLDKVGVRREVLSYGANSGLFSLSRPWTEAERGRLREHLHAWYEAFVGRAAAGRGMDRDALDAHARGRIWTGEQAVERGLVDKIGGLEAAVQAAAEKAGLGRDYEVWVVEPEHPGPLDRLRRLLPGARAGLPLDAAEATELLEGLEGDADLVQARLPYLLRIR